MSQHHRTLSRWLPALALGLALSACSSNMDELQSYIAEVKARPAQSIEPIPPVKTYSPYVYDGESGRDPFRTSTSEGSDANAELAGASGRSGPRPDFDRTKEYLERFELDTLSMVGTFGQGDNYWGLIRDPDGVVHRVSVDDYMGKNHGKIVAIRDNEVVLTELITDGLGGWLVREATVALDGT